MVTMSLYTFSLFFILFTHSHASFLTSTYGTPDSSCNSTPYPEFCKSNLPYNKPGTLYDYGRISLDQSLSHSKQFLGLIRYFLKISSPFYPSIKGALEDCEFLAQLNCDSLAYTSQSINYTNTLQTLQAIDLQTLLSATLTNLDTCLDGLQASLSPFSSIIKGLITPLTNGTMHYSISLALFTSGWVPPQNKGRSLSEKTYTFFQLENGVQERLPLNMSTWDRDIYESISNRKLLQTSSSVVVSQMVVVNKNGSGNYTSINDAIAAAPNNTASGSGYFVIYVVKGTYYEYVSIPKNKQYLMMIGEGINKTIITGNLSVVDGSTTFNSATFAVVGQGFVAMNITFRNTAGAVKQQAVALRNGADLSAFYSCSFEGYQDTLYAHSLRQFYRGCEIYGTIDYIFGNAAAVFQNCKIYSRQPLSSQYNTITAQGRTDPNQNTGISIQNCTIKAAKDLLASSYNVSTYLGRPWKEYSRTIFMQSYMASLIDPAGWAPWSGDFAISTLYYAEFNNIGAGAKTSKRVTWPGYHLLVNATDAYNFTVSNFTQGNFWLSATGVPFTAGLM